MNKNRVRHLRQDFDKLRRQAQGGIPHSELESLARRLGRELVSGRGKHPTWVSTLFSDLSPVSIPAHAKPLLRFTAQSILNSLELDLERLESEVNQQAGDEDESEE
jgi:hypothetical protein